jgi:hypothetical protein
MWIRLKDNIPNIEGGTPPVHSIFWAVRWVDISKIKAGFQDFIINVSGELMNREHRKWAEEVVDKVGDLVWANPAYIDQWYEDEKKKLEAKVELEKNKEYKFDELTADYDLLELERVKKMVEEYFKGEAYGDAVRQGCMIPNYAGLHRIRYNDKDIGIWRHEFEEVSANEIMEAVEAGDYILIPDSVAEGTLVTVTDESLSVIIDTAMLDGCTKEQAKLVAIGVDITEEFELPPMGWYKFVTTEEAVYEVSSADKE